MKQQQSTPCSRAIRLVAFNFAAGFYSLSSKVIDPQLTFFSDEAFFHLQGYINTQINNRYWSSQNPHLTHEVPLHPVKVGVCCPVSARCIVGPVFLTKQLIAKDMYWSLMCNSFQS
jgi:hypothetical protein